ncbi:MAG: hypothetical protein QG580_275 [Patescibacteria group bacterium]|jgi:hypothetical protein|nr:hypothetical protein [Patescibacteria group bacterium]
MGIYKVSLESPRDDRDMDVVAVILGDGEKSGQYLNDGHRYLVSKVVNGGEETHPGYVLLVRKEGREHRLYLQSSEDGEPRPLYREEIGLYEFIFHDFGTDETIFV